MKESTMTAHKHDDRILQQQKQGSERSSGRSDKAQDEAKTLYAHNAARQSQFAQQSAVGAQLANAPQFGAQAPAAQLSPDALQIPGPAQLIDAGGKRPATPMQIADTVNAFGKSRGAQAMDLAASQSQKQNKTGAKSDKTAAENAKTDKKDAGGNEKTDKKAGAGNVRKEDADNEKTAKKEDAGNEKTAKKENAQNAGQAKENAGKSEKTAQNSNKKEQSGAKTRAAKQSDAKTGAKAQAGKIAKGGGAGIATGGGGAAVPQLGANAPKAPARKPEGTGKNAVEAFANSGLSRQIESHAGLGEKADADLKKSEAEKLEKLPGEENAEIADPQADAQLASGAEETKSKNAQNKEVSFAAKLKTNLAVAGDQAKQLINNQKAAINGANGEDLPAAPAVQADTSGIDSAQNEEQEQYAAAKEEAAAKTEAFDKTLPQRDFGDIAVPKAVLDESDNALQTAQTSLADELAKFDDEAKGILDVSREASQTSPQMQEAAAKIDDAEKQSANDIQNAVDQHEQEIDDRIARAKEEQDAQIQAQTSKMDEAIAAEESNFEAQAGEHHAAQDAEIAQARQRIADEKANVDRQVQTEKSNAENEQNKAREEDNKEKSRLDKAVDFCKKFVSKLASKLKSIVNKFVSFVTDLLSAFADLVSLVNKELGEKLKAAIEKFKEFITQLIDAIFEIIEAVIQAVIDAVAAIVSAVVDFVKAAVEAFKAIVSEILALLKAAFDAALEGIKAVLESLADIAKAVFEKACELAGVDPSIFASAAAVYSKIIADPGTFFSALGNGFVNGFKNFFGNMPDNLWVMANNLVGIWFGAVGVSVPKTWTVASAIKFGLEIIGIDVGGILSATGLQEVYDKHIEEEQKKRDIASGKQPDIEEDPKKEDKKDDSELMKLYNTFKEGGIDAVIPYMKEHAGDLVKDILLNILKTVAPEIAMKALAKLASLATPLSGIITVIKGIYDLYKFVKDNMSALSGLANAIVSVMGTAAEGNSSAVASAVEAVICQAVPLLFEMLLRAFGINIGGVVQKAVIWIRTRIMKLYNTFAQLIQNQVRNLKNTKAGKAVTKRIDNAKDKAKDKSKQVNQKIMDSDSEKLQKARNLNQNAANAGRHASYQADKYKGKTSVASDVVKGVTSTLQGDKNGSLGVNLYSKEKKETENYLKYFSEAHKNSIDPQSKDYEKPLDSFETYTEKQTEKDKIKKEDKEKYEKTMDAIVAEKAKAEGKSKWRILMDNPDLLYGSYHSEQYYDYAKRKADAGESAMAYDKYAPKYIDWRINDYLTGYVSGYKDGEKLKPREYIEQKESARENAYEKAASSMKVDKMIVDIITRIDDKIRKDPQNDADAKTEKNNEKKSKEDTSVGSRACTADAAEKLKDYGIASDQIENVIKNGQSTVGEKSVTYYNDDICITADASGKITDVQKVKKQANLGGGGRSGKF